jgi:hypothetical protein
MEKRMTITRGMYQDIHDSVETVGICKVMEDYILPIDFPFEDLGVHISSELEIIMFIQNPDYHIPHTYLTKAIEDGHIDPSTLKYVSMNHIILNGKDFISRHMDNLDQEKLLLYYLSTETPDKDYLDKITNHLDKHSLWNLISSVELPKSFIRDNKEKLNWSFVSIVNHFTEEEVEEFKEHLTFDPYAEKKKIQVPIGPQKENNMKIGGFFICDVQSSSTFEP